MAASQLTPIFAGILPAGPVDAKGLRIAFDYLLSTWTLTSGWTLSDGTNNFTLGTVEGWYRRINGTNIELFVGGTFTTGATVVGALLRIANSDWVATFDTAGTMYGMGHGIVCTQAGADPRVLVTASIPTASAVQWTRANSAAWAASTAYAFNARAIVPIK